MKDDDQPQDRISGGVTGEFRSFRVNPLTSLQVPIYSGARSDGEPYDGYQEIGNSRSARVADLLGIPRDPVRPGFRIRKRP